MHNITVYICLWDEKLLWLFQGLYMTFLFECFQTTHWQFPGMQVFLNYNVHSCHWLSMAQNFVPQGLWFEKTLVFLKKGRSTMVVTKALVNLHNLASHLFGWEIITKTTGQTSCTPIHNKIRTILNQFLTHHFHLHLVISNHSTHRELELPGSVSHGFLWQWCRVCHLYWWSRTMIHR